MIFANPIAGLSAGLGASTPDTKRLRAAMNVLATAQGDKNLSPCDPSAASCPADGDVDKQVVFGLFYAAGRLLGKVPGADELTNSLQ
ncbi:hypothetical protein LCGC14_2998510, partial [marine sediment metagenome]